MSVSVQSEWAKPGSAEIGALASLSYVARGLLGKSSAPLAFVELLLAQSLYGDALRFLAYGLPMRRAIWWGCLCVGRAANTLPDDQEASLQAAARWAREPGELQRKAAEQVMGEAALNTPAGRLAWAVHVLSPRVPFPGGAPIPPQPELAARAINGAVQGAAAAAKGKRLAGVQREFVALGIHVLHGRNLWDSINCS